LTSPRTPLPSKRKELKNLSQNPVVDTGPTTTSRRDLAENIMTPSDRLDAFGGYVGSTLKNYRTQKFKRRSMLEIHTVMDTLLDEEENKQ
jgi:hypothetical protein